MKNNNARTKSISRIRLVESAPSTKRRVFSTFLILAIVASGFYFAYRLGGTISGTASTRDQLTMLKQQVEQLDSEKEKLSSTANSADSELNIERSTQKQLANQVQALTDENNRLKEDLAFFENLIPASSGSEGVKIGAFKADASNKSQVQYRLLVMQGGKNVQDFHGNIQFQMTLLENGRTTTVTVPQNNTDDLATRLKLSFKYYQRLEGTLPVPEGAVIKMLQARVLDKGQLRTYQSINF